MAESTASTKSAKSEKDADGFELASGPATTVTTTDVTPAEADKTSAPNANDAKANQPPVRTNRPDVPIAQVLTSGAGAHTPPDDPHIGSDGRFYADADEAKATHESGINT